MTFSEFQPRHVFCFLGREAGFPDLHRSIQVEIDRFAAEFEVDTHFSQDAPDDRMAPRNVAKRQSSLLCNQD